MSADLHEDGPLLHEVIRALQEELATVSAERDRLRAALRIHAVTQWEDGWHQCHVCMTTTRDGLAHAPDCLLAALPPPPGGAPITTTTTTTIREGA